MNKNKHRFIKKVFAVFLSAVLIGGGINPVKIHAAEGEDLVSFTHSIPILGYYEDEAPTGFIESISTSYKTDSNKIHRSYPNGSPEVSIDWDSETKTISYTLIVDRSEDGWVNTLISFPDGRGGHGAQHIPIPSDTDAFTFVQGAGYPDNIFCGEQALNIRLMLDKGTLYENYITGHRNKGFVRTIPNPTKEGYEFVAWRMPSGAYFNPDYNNGTPTDVPMTLYAVWRGADGNILDSPEAPTASKEAGNYDESFDVELTAESGCDIYYTTDGSKPTKDSTRYDGAITVTGTPGEDTTTTIRAIAVKDGLSSEIANFEYILHIPSPAPAVTPTPVPAATPTPAPTATPAPNHTHDYGTEWKTDNDTHWHECDCGAKTDIAAHTEDAGTIISESTEDDESVKVYKCSVCGHTIRTEILESSEPNSTEDDEINNDDSNDDNDDNDDGTKIKKSTNSGNTGSAPKTGDTSHPEIYATVAMIAGLSYLLLYFANDGQGMTEEKKKELVSRLIGWAKRGSVLRRYIAVSLICLLLVYYHSIGKRMTVDWKKIYD